MHETIRLPGFRRDAEMRAESFDPAANTIAVIWTTGASVRRRSFADGEFEEELIVDDKAVRLDRLNRGAPFLNTHDAFDLRSVLGSVVPGSARIDQGRGIATIQLTRRAEAEGIVQDLRDGIIRNVSVGYRIHAVERQERDGGIPLHRAIDWEPLEISAVPVSADPGAQVMRADAAGGPQVFDCLVTRAEASGLPSNASLPRKDTAMTDRDISISDGDSGASAGAGVGNGARQSESRPAAAEAGAGPSVRGGIADRPDPSESGETPAPAAARPAPGVPTHSVAAPVIPAPAPAPANGGRIAETPQAAIEADIAGAVREAITAERNRATEIRLLARRFGLADDFVQPHIDQGSDVPAFRNALIDRLAEDGDRNQTFPHVRIGAQDADETRRQAMVGALLHRHDADAHPLGPEAREWRGLTLLEMVRESLRQRGERVTGLGRDELARRAFHTTSDFPAILEAVVNKTLRSAYEVYPQTFRPFCRKVGATDFKEMHRLQLGEAPQLLKINEHGEFKRGTIREGKESFKVETYGRVVGITRRTLINDDLGAFTRIPQMYGTAIATLESDIVWGIFLDNAKLADGKALFHADHGNLAAAGTALSAAAIGAARAAMARQKGLDGKTVLNIRPAFVAVPSELEFALEQILNTALTPAQPNQAVPNSIRSLTTIAEPRLSTISATNWHLIASPGQIDTIEYAYLEGREGAYMETRNGFDIDGMEIKCRLDFGAAPIDWRGFYRDPGAAPA